VLNDPQLSQEYKIRAITRDVNSAKSKQLKDVVDVVQGDVFDPESLKSALSGVHTVFIMNAPSFGPDGLETEFNSVKAIADTALEKSVKYIIFSTLPPIAEISGGKYTRVTPFDAKAKAEQYIRSLPIKSAFICPGSFMENFLSEAQAFLAPRKAPDGTWVFSRHNSPESRLPLIDAVGDTGKFVGAILAEPDKYEGKSFYAATALYSLEEIAAILSKATGQTFVYKQISVEDFQKGLPFDDETFIGIFVDYFSYVEDFGYYGGTDAAKKISWAVENARGKVSTLEEFLVAHPLRLE